MPNGKVLEQKISIAATVMGDQTYTYTRLNRLTGATEMNGTTTNWSQTYQCDQFGNLATTSSSSNIQLSNLTPQSTSAFNSKNQISASQYDLAGNMWMDAANNAYYYDAENHQTSCNVNVNGTASTSSYTYDGDGRRISKTMSAGTTIFVYDAGGRMVAEYGGQTSSTNAGTSYLTTDHLGSTRVVTNSGGSVIARHDYLPFGGELQSGTGGRTVGQGYGASDDTRQKFTSKERDAESNLDYFEARYLSSAQGRFTSPDEFAGGPEDVEDFTDTASDNPTFYADVHNPQSLNKYQYCYNNPLRYADPNGHDCRVRIPWKRGSTGSGAAVGTAMEASMGSGGNPAAVVGLIAVGTVMVIADLFIHHSDEKKSDPPPQAGTGQPQSDAQPAAPAAAPAATPSDEGRKGGRNQAKDRSLEGALDQQAGIHHAQDKKKKHKPRGFKKQDAIRDTTKSDDNADHEIQRYIDEHNADQIPQGQKPQPPNPEPPKPPGQKPPGGQQ